MLETRFIIAALNKTVYIALLILGCYFIYQGQVVERFVDEKCDFSDYPEDVSELPTLQTFISPYNDVLMYGHDFNISYGVFGLQSHNLTLGINTIVPDVLQVHFEQLYGLNVFKISPLNFSTDISKYYLWYNLSYIFSSNLKLNDNTQVVTIISSENNSVPASS